MSIFVWFEVIGHHDDVDALRQLADRCDVFTYEFKMSTPTALTLLSKMVSPPQGTDSFRISQNRIFEKDFLSNKAKVTVALTRLQDIYLI